MILVFPAFSYQWLGQRMDGLMMHCTLLGCQMSVVFTTDSIICHARGDYQRLIRPHIMMSFLQCIVTTHKPCLSHDRCAHMVLDN
jgi:hypothetical protein